MYVQRAFYKQPHAGERITPLTLRSSKFPRLAVDKTSIDKWDVFHESGLFPLEVLLVRRILDWGCNVDSFL